MEFGYCDAEGREGAANLAVAAFVHVDTLNLELASTVGVDKVIASGTISHSMVKTPEISQLSTDELVSQ